MNFFNFFASTEWYARWSFMQSDKKVTQYVCIHVLFLSKLSMNFHVIP